MSAPAVGSMWIVTAMCEYTSALVRVKALGMFRMAACERWLDGEWRLFFSIPLECFALLEELRPAIAADLHAHGIEPEST